MRNYQINALILIVVGILLWVPLAFIPSPWQPVAMTIALGYVAYSIWNK